MAAQFESMEHTFMTIHNLSPEANILFASASVSEILGYEPHEVQGRSCFDYFHPDEEPWARRVHGRGIRLDKAASLHYLRVQHRNGQWVSCEVCFTIVHDVLVACTSIYRINAKSERRAVDAPQIRRIFSSSPRDPRYHMLEHLSPKFKMPPVEREPRAALILNRFTRPLSIMFATDSVSQILGLRPDQLQHKSFYECITNNCLADAVRCLESAKSNDSIAYLRFWFRDPRTEEDLGGEDEEMDGVDDRHSPSSSDLDSDGGAQLSSPMDIDDNTMIKNEPQSPDPTKAEVLQAINGGESSTGQTVEASNGGPSSRRRHVTGRAAQDGQNRQIEQDRRNGSNGQNGPNGQSGQDGRRDQNGNGQRRAPLPSIELEAVVSCTSDGLVVILRRARPAIPNLDSPSVSAQSRNGLFAAPWGEQPIQPYYAPELYHQFRSPLMPQYMPLQEHAIAAGGPPIAQLMHSIRDVAVFAWALVGINGNLAGYCQGTPRGEAQPPVGIPVWDPNVRRATWLGPENQARVRWQQWDRKELGVNSSNNSYTGGPPAVQYNGYGVSNVGLGHVNPYYTQPSWAQPGPYTHVSYPPPAYSLPPYASHFSSNHRAHDVQEPWGGAAVNPAQQQQEQQQEQQQRQQYGDPPVPTTQAPKPTEEPPNYRHMWQ